MTRKSPPGPTTGNRALSDNLIAVGEPWCKCFCTFTKFLPPAYALVTRLEKKNDSDEHFRTAFALCGPCRSTIPDPEKYVAKFALSMAPLVWTAEAVRRNLTTPAPILPDQ